MKHLGSGQNGDPLEASERMHKNSGKERILFERSEFIRGPNFSNERTNSVRSGFSGCHFFGTFFDSGHPCPSPYGRVQFVCPDELWAYKESTFKNM